MKKHLFAVLFGVFISPLFATGIDSGAASADCDSATLGQTSGTANLEMDWQPNTINIRWYDGENQLSVPTNAQTCSYDGALYLPTAPTKKGYTFEGWEVKYAIPEEYTELEYIESTGTQCIDTGFKFTGNVVKYELVYTMPNLMGSNKTLFGASDNNVNWSGLEYFYNYSGYANGNVNNESALYIGGRQLACHITNPVDTIIKNSLIVDRFNQKYKLQRNNNKCSGSFPGTVTSTVSIALFAHKENNSNSFIQKSNYRCYSFKITQDGVLMLNFIPTRRKSDNVIGMYDTVTKTFFTNAGTGTFIAGPVVP